MKIWKGMQISVLIAVLTLFLCGSIAAPLDFIAKVRLFSKPYEFNYINWTLDAFAVKIGESGLAIDSHTSDTVQHRVVTYYFNLAKRLDIVDASIQRIYANPDIANPDQIAEDWITKRNEYQTMLDQMAPSVEEILQQQVKTVLAQEGLDLGGQTIPPVLYHTTPLPKALIVSPRSVIREDADISLLADMPLDRIVKLESDVEKNLGVSALVVDVGGVGMYPTMVERSSDITWVIQTIAHEWTHNYLTLHPLGINYDTSNDLRTMNETTAAIVGEEISREVILKYYPEMAAAVSSSKPAMKTSVQADTFDFNTEMHTTRVTVDALLKQGKIDEAETYMEIRRQVFLDHGYLIRKLNQAYFAFYGAYANTPGGAAGEDPVGPAVRALRAQSGSLRVFLRQIAWMSSFAELQAKVNP